MPPAASQPQPSGEDRSALTKVMLFAIIQLIGLVATWASTFYLFGTIGTNPASLNLGPNPTPAQVSTALGPTLQEVSVLVPIGIGLGFIGLVFLAMGFRQFSRLDKPSFSVPSTLTIVMLVGLVLVGVAIYPLLSNIPNIISQAPSSGSAPSTSFSNLISSLLLEAGLILLGGLLVLIGEIGGVILGLWRVGSRYDETVTKVGAIFTIIPLLNIVAPILILVGAAQSRNKVPRA
jgi:Protein of unknown function (DUF973)